MIILYTDGSNSSTGITSNAWHSTRGPTMATMFEGHCQIEPNADIEDGEIHAIQEGLRQLVNRNMANVTIVMYADNQNALRALAGGPTAGRE